MEKSRIAMSVSTSITPYKAGGLGARVDPDEYRKRAQGEISALFGDVELTGVGGRVNLDAWSSHAAIKAGLAFELSGRATIVQARVATHLTSFDDPLKVSARFVHWTQTKVHVGP